MGHPILGRLLILIYRQISEVTWTALAAFVVIHMLFSWVGFVLAGETDLRNLGIFWYFYATTATTVGYGDYSPGTDLGRAVTVFWIMPGGIILFTATIGKLIQNASDKWRQRMKGLGDYSGLEDQVVIFGWHPFKTRRLVAMLLADNRYGDSPLVLVDTKIEENPMPDRLKFVSTESMSSDDALNRSGITSADAAIIFGRDDYETLTTAFAVSALSKDTRVVAYFESDSNADLLLSHCPMAECTVSISTELMARSAYDPGSCEIQRQVLSTLDGPTQFSVVVPDAAAAFKYQNAFTHFKDTHDATLIAVKTGTGHVEVNAGRDHMVNPGDRLFYISTARVLAADVSWAALG